MRKVHASEIMEVVLRITTFEFSSWWKPTKWIFSTRSGGLDSRLAKMTAYFQFLQSVITGHALATNDGISPDCLQCPPAAQAKVSRYNFHNPRQCSNWGMQQRAGRGGWLREVVYRRRGWTDCAAGELSSLASWGNRQGGLAELRWAGSAEVFSRNGSRNDREEDGGKHTRGPYLMGLERGR